MTTRLQRAVQDQEFLITAEITPPKGGNTSHMLEMALREAMIIGLLYTGWCQHLADIR